MRGLASLIEKDTRQAEQPPVPPPQPPPAPNPPPPQQPAQPTQPPQQAQPTQPATEQKKTFTEKDFEATGEVNASMFAFCVESPLYAFNGIYTKIKIRKAKKNIKDEKLLAAEIAKLEKNYEDNKDIIEIDDDEYKHIKNAFTAMAKQKGQGEADATMLIASAVIGCLIRRAEIMID